MAYLADLPRILVIDDDDTILDLLSDVLSSDYEIHTARDALEAVEWLESEATDLIISDFYLPVLSGCELIQIIRNQREFDAVPILCVSAYPDLYRNIGCAQVQGFLTKPFDINELSRAVAEGLDRTCKNHTNASSKATAN